MSATENPLTGFGDGSGPFLDFGWRVQDDDTPNIVVLELFAMSDVEAVTQLGLKPDDAKALSKRLSEAADTVGA
jgi:hypothetical protein